MARTIADLEAATQIIKGADISPEEAAMRPVLSLEEAAQRPVRVNHIAEAISYRTLDRGIHNNII